jgi:hypothetical protein
MGSADHRKGVSPEEFVERLKALIAAHIAGSNEVLARFGHFVQEASKAVGTAPMSDRTSTQTALSRWLDFNLASYSVMTTGSLAMLQGLISAAEETLIPKPGPSLHRGGHAKHRIELRMSGRPGEKTAAGFALENNLALPLTVAFECGQLIPQTGLALGASHVSFEPATLVIPPKGQAVVQAIVSITHEFQVGETYTSTVRLLGSDNKEIGLSVTVLPPLSRKEQARRPRKPATKRRSRK